MSRKKEKKKGNQKKRPGESAKTFIDTFKTLQNNSSNAASEDDLSVPKELNSDESTLGTFKGNKQNGQGTFTYPSGNVYAGEWQDDLKNGQGTITFLDGEKYVGNWNDGQALEMERTNRWSMHEQEYVRLKQHLLNLQKKNI